MTLNIALNLTESRPWAPYALPAVMVLSALPVLVLGPRRVAAVFIADAVLWVAAGWALGRHHRAAALVILGLLSASFLMIGMWPAFEQQQTVSRRDMWYRAAAGAGIYLGFAIAHLRGALRLEHMVGVTGLLGAVGLIQAVIVARSILRGPPEAIHKPAFRAVRPVAADQRPVADGEHPAGSARCESTNTRSR